MIDKFSLKKLKEWKVATLMVIVLGSTFTVSIFFSLHITYAQNTLKTVPNKQNPIVLNSSITLSSNTNQYPIKYHIMNGRISGISIERDNTTLLLNISSASNGNLIIDLPRNVIDSKGPGNVDDNFTIFEDGQYVSYNEIGTSSKSRTIMLNFNSPSVIEITGTRTLPEFPNMTIVTLAMSIAGLVICGRKFDLTYEILR